MQSGIVRTVDGLNSPSVQGALCEKVQQSAHFVWAMCLEKVFDEGVALAVGEEGVFSVGGEGAAETAHGEEAVFVNGSVHGFLIVVPEVAFRPGGQAFVKPRGDAGVAVEDVLAEDDVGDFVGEGALTPVLASGWDADGDGVVPLEGHAAGPLLGKDECVMQFRGAAVQIYCNVLGEGCACLGLQKTEGVLDRVEEGIGEAIRALVPTEADMAALGLFPGEALVFECVGSLRSVGGVSAAICESPAIGNGSAGGKPAGWREVPVPGDDACLGVNGGEAASTDGGAGLLVDGVEDFSGLGVRRKLVMGEGDGVGEASGDERLAFLGADGLLGGKADDESGGGDENEESSDQGGVAFGHARLVLLARLVCQLIRGRSFQCTGRGGVGG